MNQKTAIIYSRVSTNKQWQQWESLEEQEKACMNYCERNNIKVLCKPFREQFTWTKSERPKFNEALSFINNFNDKVDYCIIYKIDRSTRWWFEVYNDIKKKLIKYWVTLKDIQWIIQEEKNIIEIAWVNTDKYDWAKINPWKYSEHLQVMFSEEERNQILQRMIGQQIRNANNGYQVRQSNYWFKNKTIISNEWKKKVIQVEHPEESIFIKKIFELRAKWYLSDPQIVDEINSMWYKSRGKNKWNYDKTQIIWVKWCNKLNVKTMQVYLKSTIYAWVIIEEWTWFKPIKAQYKWLISIELFNKANRGKIHITENKDWGISVLYWDKKQEEPIIEKRLSFNPEYPYSKVLKCPICSWFLTPNRSKSWNGSYYYYYQCKWKNWIKHKNYKIDRWTANQKILEFIKDIKPRTNIINSFNDILDFVWKNKKSEIEKHNDLQKARIYELKQKQESIISSLDNFVSYPKILEAKNKELETIEVEISLLSQNSTKNINTLTIQLDEFKYISNLILTQLDKLAIKTEKPEIIKLTFDMIFEETPTFEEIESHTIKMFPIFSVEAKKNLQMSGDFSKIFYGGA